MATMSLPLMRRPLQSGLIAISLTIISLEVTQASLLWVAVQRSGGYLRRQKTAQLTTCINQKFQTILQIKSATIQITQGREPLLFTVLVLSRRACLLYQIIWLIYICFLIILLMTPQNTSQLCRFASFKKILTPEMIQQIIVKYIINNDPEQQIQERLVYHFRQGYFYILNAYNLPSLSVDKELRNEEDYFMKKVNEYLPDFLRVESYVIEDMRQAFVGIPVSGAIITNKWKDKFLFVQDRRTGKYGLCKGKIAQGETLEECAIREVREETGYRVTKLGRSYEQQVYQDFYMFFEAEVEENNPEVTDKIFEGKNHNREITEYVWWSPQIVKQVLTGRGKRFNRPTRNVMQRYLSAR